MAIKIPNYLYSTSADGTVVFASQVTDRDFIESHADEMSIDISNEDIYSQYSKQNEINKFIYNKFDNYIPTDSASELTTLSSSYASTASYVEGLDEKILSLQSGSTLTLREQRFSTGGYAKVYTFFQGGKEINGVSKINIDRDKYIIGGTLEKENDEIYLKISFDTENPDDFVKIPVDKLIEIYKGYNTDTIAIEIDDDNYIIGHVRTESIKDEHISPDANISLSKINLSDLHITGSSILSSNNQGELNLSFDKLDIEPSSTIINGLSPTDTPIFNAVSSSKFVTVGGVSSSLVTGDGTLIDIEGMLTGSSYLQNTTNIITNTINTITDSLTSLNNLVYSIHYKPSFTANPNVIFANNNTSITLTATLTFNNELQSDFTVTRPDNTIAVITEGTSRTFTATPTSTTTYTTTIRSTTVNYATTQTTTVTVVNPIYYGQSSVVLSNDTDAVNIFTGLTKSNSAKTSAKNTSYTIDMQSDNYFYVAIPTTLTQPSQIGVGGYSGFFETMDKYANYTIDNISYNFYKTPSTQIAGNITYYII